MPSLAGLAFAQGTTHSTGQVERRMHDLLGEMTLEEKITLVIWKAYPIISGSEYA
jgi:hypothetical protein